MGRGLNEAVLFHYGPISVTLLFPNGGDEISAGSTSPITWMTAADSLGDISFKLKYSLDNGLTWLPVEPVVGATNGLASEYSIAESFTGTDANWAVPLLRKNKTKCLVKVIAYKGTRKLGSDESDRPFSIKVLSITRPSPEGTCTSGQPCTITWEKVPAVDAQTGVLSYSTDGGLTWKSITDAITGSDTAWNDWTPVVRTTKTNCKVKLVYKDGTEKIVATATSPGKFRIVLP